MKVDVDIRKWGDTSHYRFDAELHGRDEFGTWLLVRPPAPYTGPKGSQIFEHRFVTLIPNDAWWCASFYEEVSGVTMHTYVDIATPANWPSDDHVTLVDLDLDVIRFFDGRLLLDDEDEFEEHRVTLGYPDDVVSNARASANDVMRAVSERREPFDTVGPAWLTKS